MLTTAMIEVMQFAAARSAAHHGVEEYGFSGYQAAGGCPSLPSHDARGIAKTTEALVRRGLLRRAKPPYFDPSLGSLPPDAHVSRGRHYVISLGAWEKWLAVQKAYSVARAEAEEQCREERHARMPTAWDRVLVGES